MTCAAEAAEEHAGVPREDSLSFLATDEGTAEIRKAQAPPSADPQQPTRSLSPAQPHLQPPPFSTPHQRVRQELLSRLGVNGIPTFVLGATTVLPSGALRSQYIVQAFRELEAASEEGAPGSVFAEALGVPLEVLAEPLEIAQ